MLSLVTSLIEGKLSTETNCYSFMCSLYRELTGKDYDYNTEIFLAEEGCTPVLDCSRHPLYVQFSNSSGEDNTFNHSFVMFSENGKVYRAECYVMWVSPRVLEWPTYEDDISKLLSLEPGKDRISHWNYIFDSYENSDTEFQIDIIVNQ